MAVIPRYITIASIQTRLYGKVNFLGNEVLIDARFSENDTNNGLSDDQVATFINKAASQVEFVLSPIYTIPFVTLDGLDYTNLPAYTQEFLNELIENRTCVLILQTSFNIDTGTKGESFIKQLQDEWNEVIEKRLLKRSPEGKYQYPPLPNLSYNANQYDLSAPMQGPRQVYYPTGQALNYAARHLNDPAIGGYGGFYGPYVGNYNGYGSYYGRCSDYEWYPGW